MNKELITTNAFDSLKDFNLAEAMAEELAGMDVTFDRIKIPSGGGTVFEVPGEEPGETDAVKEFSGVILFHHPLFTYYKEKFTGGNNMPDCGSYDAVNGHGDPGGSCAQCPLNAFGSGENGGKACKNKRRVYILREGELIPLLLTLPTGSIRDFQNYVKRLLTKGRKSTSVVTRFSLKKATNTSGIAYSQAQFAMERKLTDAELPDVLGMAEQVRQFATQVGYENDSADVGTDFTVDPETGEIMELLH